MSSSYPIPRSLLAITLLIIPMATEAYSGPRGGAGHARASGGGGGRSAMAPSRSGAGRTFTGPSNVSRPTFSNGNYHLNAPQTVKRIPMNPGTAISSPSSKKPLSLGQAMKHPRTQSLPGNRLANSSVANKLSNTKLQGQLADTLANKGLHPHPEWKPLPVPHGKAPRVAHHLQSAVARHQVQQVIACAPHRILHHTHCHWWFNYLCGVYHFHHRPWICHETYWTYWTPCSYRVVRYQSYEYYVGLECITIPDIGALGVQTVQSQSPAARAGIQEGDILLSVNGRQLASGNVLTEEVATGRLVFEILRDGSTEPTVITVVPELVATVRL